MRKIIAVLILTLAGCTNFTQTGNPVDTGEIIGFTYLMTQQELSEGDRETIEDAYEVFVMVATANYGDTTIDFKALLFSEIDKKFPADNEETVRQNVAAKLMVDRYWSQVDAEYGIDAMPFSDQLAVAQQVYIGIERGMGRFAVVDELQENKK